MVEGGRDEQNHQISKQQCRQTVGCSFSLQCLNLGLGPYASSQSEQAPSSTASSLLFTTLAD